MARLGIVGAGKLGTTVARLASAAGHEVLVTDARTDPMVELIVSTVAPGSRLVGLDELVDSSDIVLLALPYSAVGSLDLDQLSDKVVVDPTNPWLETDGDDPPPSPLRSHPSLRVVRTLNHLAYEDLGEYAAPAGAPYRTALAVASDDVEARAQVAALVDSLGFDPVELDGSSAWLLDTTGPLFGRRLTRSEMGAVAAVAREASRLTW